MKLPTVQLVPFSVTSSVLNLNILLRTLFSNTLSLCSSLNVRGQVSHTHIQNNWQNYSFIYLIFTFLDGRREEKSLNQMVASIPRIYSSLNLLVHAILILIYYYCYKIFEFCHISKGSICYFYAILVSFL
jgi:hypothetical protein